MSDEQPQLRIVCSLPNGCTLYRESYEIGCHRYWSDESGRVTVIWDTALVSEITLLTAIVEEHRLYIAKLHKREQMESESNGT